MLNLHLINNQSKYITVSVTNFNNMPKKQPKNAFFYFMLEVKRNEEKRGRRFSNGLAGVSEIASKLWNVSCVFF